MSEYGEYQDAKDKADSKPKGKHAPPGGPRGDGENTGCMNAGIPAVVGIGIVALAACLRVARRQRR
ncbi:hypothetical protein [Kitasatospora sp. NPDC056800]|uniref:hypothetical protein n=1 Tax=Kitasatospora sp. NPDC056800 TaxID=3345948 RepID=UPI0036CC6582